MPSERLQARLLARGSAMLVLCLGLWWFALREPFLAGLHASVQAVGWLAGPEVTGETTSGDWSLRVPLERAVPNPAAPSGLLQLHSIEFEIKRSDLFMFTFSLPVFWALMLAVPGARRHIRSFLAGTVLNVAVEVALFFALAETTAYRSAAGLSGQPGAQTKWLLDVSDYLISGVIPYSAPFVIAICLHPGLRAYLFGREMEPQAEAANDPEQAGPSVPGGARPKVRNARGRRPADRS